LLAWLTPTKWTRSIPGRLSRPLPDTLQRRESRETGGEKR
jgi:hypothetical protein